jgi:hypothetical protein
MSTKRFFVCDGRFADRPVKDSLLTVPTAAELQSAGLANFNPDALGRVWNGVSQALEALDELPAGARAMLGERLMKYGSAQGWRTDGSGAYVTSDGRRMSDGAVRAREMRERIQAITDANRKMWPRPSLKWRSPARALHHTVPSRPFPIHDEDPLFGSG